MFARIDNFLGMAALYKKILMKKIRNFYVRYLLKTPSDPFNVSTPSRSFWYYSKQNKGVGTIRLVLRRP